MAIDCLDPDRFANFETAGCSKCRFKGCRVCRGYTMREYKAFLEASARDGQREEEREAEQDEDVEEVEGGIEEIEGGIEGAETEKGIATMGPLNDKECSRHGCLGDGEVGVNAFDVKKKVGCSKCRFRGCKKCRGYTLAELRAYEVSKVGNKQDDTRKREDSDAAARIVQITTTTPKVGQKRGRVLKKRVSCDDTLLIAQDSEELEEEVEGAFNKKTRWALGALSGLKAKVMSAVSAPLHALSSWPFWSRSSSDDEDSKVDEDGERKSMGNLDGDAPEDEHGTGMGGDDEDMTIDPLTSNKGMDLHADGGQLKKAVRKAVPRKHVCEAVPTVAFKRSRASGRQRTLSMEHHRQEMFPHLLARPNRVAPPRAQLREQLRQRQLETATDGQCPELGAGASDHEAARQTVAATEDGVIVTKKQKKVSRGSRARRLTHVDVTPTALACQPRPTTNQEEKENSTPKVCINSPEMMDKTPLTRGAKATSDDGRQLKPTKARTARLSAAKATIKPKVAKATPKATPKATFKPSDPVSIVETPAASQDRNADKGCAIAEGIPVSEGLFDELGVGATKKMDKRQATRSNASLDATQELLTGDNPHQNAQGEPEQHSTPTPEVSFSFADMAGASKDTISADQLHQYSQDEQGSHLTSACGLSPLRLPSAADSDFAFAEALQAFTSPDHDHRAVTRAMDVVGNLMSDLDVSPDAKNGCQARNQGKNGQLAPVLSPAFDFVDPNASSPELSPVTFVFPEGRKGSSERLKNRYAPASDGHLVKKTATRHRKCKSSHNHPISSLAAEKGSFESAKHLLQKKMVIKQASQDALYMKVREVIINRHLVEIHRQGHDWATLDACGVPLDTNADHAGIESKVLGSVRKEYGGETLHRLVTQVEEEWKRMCAVRQKYSKDAAAALASGGSQHTRNATDQNTGTAGISGKNGAAKGCSKTTPTRSILRQQRSSERLKGAQTLRWAPETVQHTYMPSNAQEMDEREREPTRPTSTRGLRMLGLASASPKGGAGSGGKASLSPMPPSPTGLTAMTNNTMTMTTATPGGSGGNGAGGSGGNGNGPSRRHSRTQNVQTTGTRSSQGQRLFQALQNASYPDSHQSTTPRTLAMIFDSLPECDHQSNTSSGGPTTSDTTTSSNSSRGSGGGGRWEQAEVECLIRGFREWSHRNRTQYVWKFIGDQYRGNGLSDCRTNDDLKSKWKAMRKTVGKNRRLRYVKLTEDDLEFLRSEASKP